MGSLVSGTLEARLNAIERDIQTSERNRLSLIKQKVPKAIISRVAKVVTGHDDLLTQ